MTAESQSMAGHGASGAGRVLIVSNRLPVTARRVGGELTLVRSSGGLATGLKTVHEDLHGWWIGWLGETETRDAAEHCSLERQLRELRATAVAIDPADAHTFYSRLSNGVLWPLCHDRLDRLPLNLDGWDVYERVNEQFAEIVAAAWRPGDIIWIHDYQLMRLPLLLRRRIPSARIGFFLHIPFPTPEIFLVLPARRWLMEGMLGADLIGFHTRRYRGHFTAAARRLFGIEMDADSHLRHDGRAVRLGIFPMGVDARQLNERATARPVVAKALEHRPGRERLILGIDRLDYSKGIPRRLAAIERLLLDHPEWRRNVRFLQIAVPSRGSVKAYRAFRREVEQLVTRINGRFGTPSWMPIHYMNQSVDEENLLALYRSADVMLVTPVRDGMNLVAKEFVACRSDESGVLVLSEFAGAAEELTDGLIVNPYDLGSVANAIHQALTMDGLERRTRMRALRSRVFERDVHWWTGEFLDALRPAEQAERSEPRTRADARHSDGA
jgi:trehalose 6-phosphate synthase/phosphatase